MIDLNDTTGQPTAFSTYPAGTRTISSPTVVAYDMEGDSLYLGSPVHFTIDNVINTDFVLQESPKHAYYDGATKQVVTVSRFDEFNVEMKDESGTTFSSRRCQLELCGRVVEAAWGAMNRGVPSPRRHDAATRALATSSQTWNRL